MPRATPSKPGQRRAGVAVVERAPPVGLARALEVAGDIVLVLDGEGRVLEVGGSDREQLKALVRDWRGRAWADVVTVESRVKVAEMLRDALAEPPVPPRARQVNHPTDGDDVPVLYTAVPAPEGHRGRVLALGRDLRTTMRLQQRLVEAQQATEREYARWRDAESRYRHLFQASGEATLLIDLATLKVREANPAALALMGPRAGRAVGSALAGLFEPAAADNLQDLLAHVRTDGRHEGLVARLLGDGPPVRLSAALLQEGSQRLLLIRLLALASADPALATDDEDAGAVRGRRGKVAKLNGTAVASVTDLSHLATAYLRSAQEALVFTDGEGRVVAASPAMAALLRLPGPEAMAGQLLERWLGHSGVELDVLRSRLRDGPAAATLQTECRDVLGGQVEVEVRASRMEGAPPARYAFAVRESRGGGARGSPDAAADASTAPQMPQAVQQLATLVGRVPLKKIVSETVDLIEQMSISTALDMTHNNRVLAAQLLGLSRQSLYIKLRRFGIGGDEP
jgi:PAS domain-containing protein